MWFINYFWISGIVCMIWALIGIEEDTMYDLQGIANALNVPYYIILCLISLLCLGLGCIILPFAFVWIIVEKTKV